MIYDTVTTAALLAALGAACFFLGLWIGRKLGLRKEVSYVLRRK